MLGGSGAATAGLGSVRRAMACPGAAPQPCTCTSRSAPKGSPDTAAPPRVPPCRGLAKAGGTGSPATSTLAQRAAHATTWGRGLRMATGTRRRSVSSASQAGAPTGLSSPLPGPTPPAQPPAPLPGAGLGFSQCPHNYTLCVPG